MRNEQLNIKGLCFGEVLWDNLPTGKKLGGAPLNVAYHLNKLGVPTQMLSRVGRDDNGQELIGNCQELGVPTELLQIDGEQPTSTVEVHIDAHKEVTYEIVYPVAWDFIQVNPAAIDAVKEADFFVFGSLSSRGAVSYDTLIQLLAFARYKVLDVNLRAPFYSKERIVELLGYADLVKMNKEELMMVSRWAELPDSDSDGRLVEQLMDRFSIDEFIVTYGASGAVYHAKHPAISYHFPAFAVDVKDTIGSGDSFLAAFLSKRMRSKREITIEETMGFAATVSAFVTQSSGACPSYDASTINRFEWIHYLARGEVSLY